MATLKDLLVAGPTRLIGKLFVNDATLVTNLNADMLDGKHASELTSVVKTISRSTNADHYPVFVDSNNSSLTEESLYTAAKIKFNPSTGNLVVGGKVCVGTGGTNSALGSDAANNVWLQNSTGYVVWSTNVLRRGTSLSSGQLGDTSYPWANLYTKKVTIDSSSTGANAHIEFNRTSYNYVTVPTGGTFAVSINGASANNSTLAVDANAITPGYNNKTKDIGNTTYQWRNVYAQRGLFSAAQGTAPLAVDSSTVVSNLNVDYLDGYHASDFALKYSYTLPANKGVRVQYSGNQAVYITVCGSNGSAQLVLLGTGYGAGGTIRNTFTEVVSCSTGMFTWSLPASDSLSCCVEIMSARSSDSYVNVISTGNITFTEITELTTAAQNHTLLSTANYTSYLGYIGTTPVQASSATQNLTGIGTGSFSGDITITKANSGTVTGAINGLTINTNVKSIAIGVGTAGTNRGLYDVSGSRWMLYTDNTNIISKYGSLIPGETATQDLGTSSVRWKSLHVSYGIDSSSTLYIDSPTSASTIFRNGTTEIMRVSKNGTVDINDNANTNTTNKLNVIGRTKILNGVLNITGETDYAEGIRIHSVSNISSLWFHATNETGYDAGMIGLTRDNTGLRVRLPDTSVGTSPTDRINILYGGNVGIGTTTPKTKFHVSGGQAEFNSSGTGASTITTATSGIFVGPTSQRSGTAGNYSSGIGFSHMLNYSSSYTNNSVQGWVGLRLTSTSGSELSALVLATKSGTSANDIPTERMCILPTGRIGINEKTPTTLLQITDSSNLSGGRTLFIKNATFNLAAYFYNTLSLYSAMVANSRAINIIGKAESTKNSAYWGYHHAADGSNNNFFTVGVYGVNEVLNVFGSGNVAIGSTVSPANKLDVTGVTNSTSYKVANTATIVYNASTGCLEINT